MSAPKKLQLPLKESFIKLQIAKNEKIQGLELMSDMGVLAGKDDRIRTQLQAEQDLGKSIFALKQEGRYVAVFVLDFIKDKKTAKNVYQVGGALLPGATAADTKKFISVQQELTRLANLEATTQKIQYTGDKDLVAEAKKLTAGAITKVEQVAKSPAEFLINEIYDTEKSFIIKGIADVLDVIRNSDPSLRNKIPEKKSSSV